MTEPEKWRPVAGWEGCYEVSDRGRVRSLARVVERRNGSCYRVRQKLLRPAVRGRDGYGHVSLSRRGRYKTVSLVSLMRVFASARDPQEVPCDRSSAA